MRKNTRFLDRISELLAKPVDFLVSLLTREPRSFIEFILCSFSPFLLILLCLALGPISTLLSSIRSIIGGDPHESK